MQSRELDTSEALKVLLLQSVLGVGMCLTGIAWAVTAESGLDRFFAYSILFFGVITLHPTLVARGVRMADALRPGS